MPDYDPDDFDDPRHPDHDLSESGIGMHRDYDAKPIFLRRGLVWVEGIALIVAIAVIPIVLIV
jgi:hypothetical protein